MLEQIGSAKFAEWMAFDRLDPIGGRRGDAQAALIAQILANLFGRDPEQSAFNISDFMLDFSPARKTEHELYGLVRSWAILNGAKAPELRAAAEVSKNNGNPENS